jgi:hypothetical protein
MHSYAWVQHRPHKKKQCGAQCGAQVRASLFSVLLHQGLTVQVLVPNNKHIMVVREMWDTIKYLIGAAGPSGFGSKSTAEDVTAACNLDSLTAIITGNSRLPLVASLTFYNKTYCLLHLISFIDDF